MLCCCVVVVSRVIEQYFCCFIFRPGLVAGGLVWIISLLSFYRLYQGIRGLCLYTYPL